jgi:acyl-CoA synthetase (AMP-forming)/AMP-acid ligase II
VRSAALVHDRLDLACGGLLPFTGDETCAAICEAADGAVSAQVSRGELRSGVARLAQQLATGDKRLAVLLATNSIASVTALLAALAAGHAVALVDPAIVGERWAALLEAYRPDFILSPAGLARPTAAGASDWPAEVTAGVDVARSPTRLAPLLGEGDVLLSTSGTTGSAKFVRLAAAALAANASQIASVLRVTPGDVGAAHLPIHYSYGLSILTSHLAVGASVVLIEDGVTTPTFWKSLGAAGATHFPGVPFHYQVLSRLGLRRLAPPSVTTFTQAGGALDLEIQKVVHAQAADRGARFYVMYGQTEASPRIATLDNDALPDRVGSVGRAMPGAKLSVLDADGLAAPAGQIGEVVYEGPNVMLGYAVGREDLDRGDEAKGRLVTGDLGYLDDEGFLFITGRAKRFAKIYGLRINLDEVERRVGRPNAVVDRGEQIIILHEAGDGSLEEFKSIASEIAAEYRLPVAAFEVKMVDAIPRKESGKINYGEIRELL